MSKVLSAVAWPYANGPRHIGHVAGFGVPSDVFSRYMRMAGHDVLMVSGTDEHGTPILVAADKEGVSAAELADRNNRLIVEDLAALGLSYDLFTRTTTRNHYAVAQEMFTHGPRATATWSSRPRTGAISPSTGRTLPDRYIEGTCPICGYDSARGDQCDNCGNQLDPTDLIDPRSKINGETPEFIETQHFFLDLPALADALGEWLDEREATGTWRPNVIKFSLNILEDIRPRAMTRDIDWGIPVPLDGLARATRPSGSTCGSTRSSATCRRRSSGPAAAATPSAGASGGTTPRPCPTTSWARTTSPSTPRSGRPSCSATTARATRAASPGAYGALQPADRGGQLGVPHHGGQAVLLQPRRRHLRPRRARALPARRAALLHLRGRPGEPGHRLHLGRVRPAHQRRARRRLGQPGQPHGDHDPQELRRDPGGRRARPRPTRRCWTPSAAAFDDRRRPDRPAPAEARPRRGDADRRRGQQVRLRPGAVEAQGRRPSASGWRTVLHVARPGRQRLQHAALAVPAAQRQRRARGARRRGRRLADAAHRGGRRTSTTAGRALPGHHRRLHRDADAGSRGRSWPGRRWPSPTPIFTKLDPSVVDEELARLAGDTDAGDGRMAMPTPTRQARPV